MIVDELVEDSGLSNKQKRFQCYRAIVVAKYGQLPKGVRRRLVVCIETFVHEALPNVEYQKYVGYKNRSAD